MARPKKDGLNYFPHDVDSLIDPKLEPAIMIFGANAYAFYFVHLEYIYKSNDLYIDISDTPEGREMQAVIQRKLSMSEETYNAILDCFLRRGAFDAGEYAATGRLTSNGIKKRAAAVFKKRTRSATDYEESKRDKEQPKEDANTDGGKKAQTPNEQRNQQRLTEARDIYAELPSKVKKTVATWLEYKKERHESYKPTGYLTLMRTVKKSVVDFGANAVIEVINHSMAAPYQGITWDRLQRPANRSGTSNPFLDKTSNPFLDSWRDTDNDSE